MMKNMLFKGSTINILTKMTPLSKAFYASKNINLIDSKNDRDKGCDPVGDDLETTLEKKKRFLF